MHMSTIGHANHTLSTRHSPSAFGRVTYEVITQIIGMLLPQTEPPNVQTMDTAALFPITEKPSGMEIKFLIPPNITSVTVTPP